MEVRVKKCSKCQEVKGIKEGFSNSKGKANSWCKECTRSYNYMRRKNPNYKPTYGSKKGTSGLKTCKQCQEIKDAKSDFYSKQNICKICSVLNAKVYKENRRLREENRGSVSSNTFSNEVEVKTLKTYREVFGNLCCYSTLEMETPSFDHVIPHSSFDYDGVNRDNLSRKITGYLGNIAICDKRMNSKKHNRSLKEFLLDYWKDDISSALYIYRLNCEVLYGLYEGDQSFDEFVYTLENF